MTQGHGPLFHKFHEIQEFMTPWHGHSAPPPPPQENPMGGERGTYDNTKGQGAV